MTRWEPNARGRLEEAAMELFQERGYAQTTVQEIAARAGLTERTFFRYFTDKREVLFSGSKGLEKNLILCIASAPPEASPLDAVTTAFEAVGAALQEHREPHFMRARYALVLQHSELQERELVKLASLGVAVTKALHARGVSEPTASLVAETGLVAFKVGFERWVHEKKARKLATHIRAAAKALKEIASGGPAKAPRPAKKARRA